MNLNRRQLLQLAALLTAATAAPIDTDTDTEEDWIDPVPPAPAASGWWPGGTPVQ